MKIQSILLSLVLSLCLSASSFAVTKEERPAQPLDKPRPEHTLERPEARQKTPAEGPSSDKEGHGKSVIGSTKP